MGRDSHKGQYLGGSHILPLCPTICDCNTRIKKNGDIIAVNANKLPYDKVGTKNDSKMYI